MGVGLSGRVGVAGTGAPSSPLAVLVHPQGATGCTDRLCLQPNPTTGGTARAARKDVIGGNSALALRAHKGLNGAVRCRTHAIASGRGSHHMALDVSGHLSSVSCRPPPPAPCHPPRRGRRTGSALGRAHAVACPPSSGRGVPVPGLSAPVMSVMVRSLPRPARDTTPRSWGARRPPRGAVCSSRPLCTRAQRHPRPLVLRPEERPAA